MTADFAHSLLLDTTRFLLAQPDPDALCHGGLAFLAGRLEADLGMLHLRHSDQEYRLLSQVGEHPLMDVHHVQIMEPAWEALLQAGAWISAPVPSPDWTGPAERSYTRLGAQHLVNFGLYNGPALVGTVNLLFRTPRPDLGNLEVLGTVGALWGTLLSRMRTQQDLASREAMLRTVTDQSTDVISVVDEQGLIRYQSAASSTLLGYPPEALIGERYDRGIHRDDLGAVNAAMTDLRRVPGGSAAVTFRVWHAAGQLVWLEAHAHNLLHDPAVQGVVIHVRNVTVARTTQRHLERRVQELTLMHATGQELQRARTEEDVARHVVDLIEQRLAHPFVQVGKLEPDGSVVSVSREAARRHLPAARLPPGQGLIGACVSTGRSVLVPDVHQDSRYLGRHDSVRSELVVPVHVSGVVWGVLNVESERVSAFDDEDRRALETVASQAGTALANVALLNELRCSHDELRAAYDETIAGWARALDLRDRETEGHSQRVTNLSVALARRMGVPEPQLVHLRRGALLHDIGKMGIPDAILLKPGPLDEAEWTVMKRHPVLARDLLKAIGFLRPALDIPYAHHEHWNGGGYPLGLRGEAIPLPARIFAVIDVWDALRSDRSYRRAWTETQARAHLKAQAGTQFDPLVVRAFLNWLDAGLPGAAQPDAERPA
ncbi:GAF domain-containing protein (plasmid) [Deinococcus taeanensis]|uniref:HD domain-containing phosphohydrolase n=1 Tax=Deinococcus taeanensis TaxID=2737050 RepID=UPI001CDC6DB9|nr:HD domain-containing phosphohydrolase [Deinococcus taeanensis]UBV44864.1 GAF domain-containing protein [Deinococcus taeanensis]